MSDDLNGKRSMLKFMDAYSESYMSTPRKALRKIFVMLQLLKSLYS